MVGKAGMDTAGELESHAPNSSAQQRKSPRLSPSLFETPTQVSRQDVTMFLPEIPRRWCVSYRVWEPKWILLTWRRTLFQAKACTWQCAWPPQQNLAPVNRFQWIMSRNLVFGYLQPLIGIAYVYTRSHLLSFKNCYYFQNLRHFNLYSVSWWWFFTIVYA